jgi:hypothetical protein
MDLLAPAVNLVQVQHGTEWTESDGTETRRNEHTEPLDSIAVLF